MGVEWVKSGGGMGGKWGFGVGERWERVLKVFMKNEQLKRV